MWDSSTPLEILKSMPKVLEKEHLEKLELLLEADKYKNQILSGTDLCGTYAPICEGCDKEKQYPCAVAYVNYLKEQGMDIDIATEEEESVAEEVETVTEEEETVTEETESAVEEQPVEQSSEIVEENEVAEENKTVEKPEGKRIIRIATARKRR